MRTVVVTKPGVIELNYMWLPTWIGLNATLKKDMESRLAPKIEGRELDDTLLDEANEMVIEFIEEKFPELTGLRNYLDGLKYVEEDIL